MRPRVWDEFLTEQDRAHLVATNGRALRDDAPAFGQRPLLLLVDLYRWVFGDEAQPLLDAVHTWPATCGPAAWEALPHIERLLRAARQASLPVIHVTGMEGIEHWHPDAAEPAAQDAEAEARRRYAERFTIMPSVTPVAGEPVLRKAAPSAFFGTPLAAYLHQLRVDTLVVAGESTSGCVRATVVDAASLRYDVTVVEECVFDRHQASHAINLFDMAQKYADVLERDEIIAQLSKLARAA